MRHGPLRVVMPWGTGGSRCCGALRNTGRAVHVAWAKRALKRLFPQLGPVEFECEWFSTRSVDELVKEMGMSSISKSQV